MKGGLPAAHEKGEAIAQQEEMTMEANVFAEVRTTAEGTDTAVRIEAKTGGEVAMALAFHRRMVSPFGIAVCGVSAILACGSDPLTSKRQTTAECGSLPSFHDDTVGCIDIGAAALGEVFAIRLDRSQPAVPLGAYAPTEPASASALAAARRIAPTY